MRIKQAAKAGMRFGRLTIIKETSSYRSPGGQTHRRVLCACDCGKVATVRLSKFQSGRVSSCGCAHTEQLIARCTKHGQAGEGKTPNYRLWIRIKIRCLKDKHYAGRGITMHIPWVEDFLAFNTWIEENLGSCPEGCTLDRVDNNGNYEPGNLRWATRSQQNSNTRRNVLLTWNGETTTLTLWAAKQGLNWATLWQRLFTLGWELERALTTPVSKSSGVGVLVSSHEPS